MRSLRINLISESALSIRGHGVDTAFREDQALLHTLDTVEVTTNSWRKADVQHAHTLGPLAVSQLMRARGRSVVTAHITAGCLHASLLGDYFWEKPFLQYATACYNLAGAVLAVNKQTITELRHLGVMRPIIFAPNTIDVNSIQALVPKRNAARAHLGFPEHAQLVVGVGQMQPRKGIKTFIHCASLMPDVTFCWVGGQIFGPATASYFPTRRSALRAPRNIIFAGQRARSEVFSYLASADVFFLPSYHENCPMAVLEAAATGLPLVLRDLPQYLELFGNASLYGSEDMFPAIIRRCLTDESLKADLSDHALQLAKRFDSKSKAERLLSLYRLLADIDHG